MTKPTSDAVLSERKLRSLLKSRFGGVLTSGAHTENGEACALEAISVARGIAWTDDPKAVGMPDLRPINDIDVPDALRTKHLIPVLAAYSGWGEWSEERRVAVMSRVVIFTVNRLVAELPGLPVDVADKCRNADTLDAASDAANAASDAASEVASAKLYPVICRVWLDAITEATPCPE